MTSPAELQAIRERDARRGELQPPPIIRGAADDTIRGDSDQQCMRDRRALLALYDAQSDEVRRLQALLGMIYDKWENGDDCYEEPETFSGWMGKSFDLTEDENNEILAALGSAP